MKLRITFITLLLSATQTWLSAQYTEKTYPFLPPEMRTILAMDITAELEPTVVGVGDGVVTTMPGPGFVGITSDYRSKIFDGVALVSPTRGFVSTTDNIILAIDVPTRTEAAIPGFPIQGRSIVRCGVFAFALRDGHVIRLSLVDSNVRIDTVSGTGSTATMLSAADYAHVVAYDSATRTLQLINATSNAVVLQRELNGEATFLQALSDSVSLVFVTDTINDQGTERIIRPLRAIWHHTDQEHNIAGHTPHLNNALQARFTASLHGGGAVVVTPEAISNGAAKLYFAMGSRIDSIQQTSNSNPTTHNIQAGVAWWYRRDLRPHWHISGMRLAYARIESNDSILLGPAHAVPRRHFLPNGRTLTLAGSELLVITGLIEDNDAYQTLGPHLFSSVDGGFSWSMRPLSKPFATYAVDVDGNIVAAINDTIVRASINTSTTAFLFVADTIPSAITIHGDTITVCSKFVNISTDAGSTWRSWTFEGYRMGHPSRVFDHTLVLTTPFESCISRDNGRTWRSFSFDTREAITSAMILMDSRIYGAWSDSLTGGVVRDDGSPFTMPVRGDLINFGNDESFFGSPSGMYSFDDPLGATGPLVFTHDPYNYFDSQNFKREGVASLPPAYNNSNNAYFMMRNRVKRISLQTPNDIESETYTTTALPYPNPASTQVVLPEGEIHIMTMQGVIVQIIKSQATRVIDVSSWPSGSYLFETKNGHSRKAVPVLIVH